MADKPKDMDLYRPQYRPYIEDLAREDLTKSSKAVVDDDITHTYIHNRNLMPPPNKDTMKMNDKIDLYIRAYKLGILNEQSLADRCVLMEEKEKGFILELLKAMDGNIEDKNYIDLIMFISPYITMTCFCRIAAMLSDSNKNELDKQLEIRLKMLDEKYKYKENDNNHKTEKHYFYLFKKPEIESVSGIPMSDELIEAMVEAGVECTESDKRMKIFKRGQMSIHDFSNACMKIEKHKAGFTLNYLKSIYGVVTEELYINLIKSLYSPTKEYTDMLSELKEVGALPKRIIIIGSPALHANTANNLKEAFSNIDRLIARSPKVNIENEESNNNSTKDK